MTLRYSIIAVVFTLVACTQEEITPREYPRVLTSEVNNITSSGAQFTGAITFTSVAVIDHGFIWTTTGFPTLENANASKQSLGAKNEAGTFEFTLAQGLVAGKKYALRAYARSSQHIVYGKIITFTSAN